MVASRTADDDTREEWSASGAYLFWNRLNAMLVCDA